MSIKTGTEGGGAFRRRRKTPSTAQPQKPFRPVENTFPEKKGFRLGQYRVLEEKDDYLICMGYDPNAKDPFSQITPASPRTIKVAKPPALQRIAWDGKTVEIGGVEYTYEYSDDEPGVRTANGEEERIDPPYTPLDDDEQGENKVEHQIIVAVEIRKSGAVDGTDLHVVERDEDGNVIRDDDGNVVEGERLHWMDLNVSGRHWKGPGGDCTCITVYEIKPVGGPTGGTLTMNIGIDDGAIVTTESITFDWNEGAAGALTALEGHSKIASGDIAVKGGSMPAAALYVVFLSSGDLNREQPLPSTGTNSLTGGATPHFQYAYMTNADWEA